MSSVADSHARMSLTRAERQVSLGPVQVSGLSICESFASFDRNTCSWRTYPVFSGEASRKYSLGWPRAAMTRNGIAYQLQALEPHINARDSGLLPTPVANYRSGRGDNKRQGGRSLKSAIKLRPILAPEYSDLREEAHRLAEEAAKIRGQLNPLFVEWLLGFPIMWSALKP